MRLTSSLLVSGLLLGTAAGAYAEEELRSDTIIVTTPGPDRSADELIGNATKLDREDILENLSGTLGDTLANQPGVSTSFFGQGASRPVLRGLGAERVQVLTNGLGVIDASTASQDHQVSADGIDAVAIEILRGPAALAYGGQAIGGVVNVIDGLIAEELPEDPFSADLFGAYNDVNEGTELAGRTQFVTGPFVFTLSASQRDFGDYDIPGFAESSLQRALEEAEHDDDHGDDDDDHEEEEEARDTLENSFLDTQTLSAGVSWVGDNAFFGVAIREQTAEYGLPGHAHEHEEDHDDDDDDHEEEEEEGAFIDFEQTRIDVRGGIDLDNQTLTGISAAFSFVDYMHTEFEGPGEPGTIYDSEGYEGRVEFDHDIAGFSGAVGIQVLDKDLVADGEESFLSLTDTTSLGIFLFETREWDSGVGIEFGARLDSVEVDNVDFGSTDFDLFSGSFGVHKHLDNGWFLGGQLSYTERAPNETELFAFGPHLATDQYEVGDPTLDAETGLNLEGTARWSSDTMSYGVNLFVTEFSDFIFLTAGEAVIEGMLTDEEDGLPVFLFVQDDASFFGGEIYADFVVEEGPLGADWSFGTSLDFVEADLDTGGNVPLIPPLTLNATTSAEWGAWEVGAAVTVAADQDDPGIDELPTEGYTQLDLRGEVDLSDFGFGQDGTEAFVELRNVTDEEIRYSTSVLKDLVPAPDRNVRVGLRLAF